MGGVDSFDQMISYYRTEIKSKKWTLRMISYGFDAAITNAYLTYKRDCKLLGIPDSKRKDLLAFRLELCDLLVESTVVLQKANKRGRPSLHPPTDDEPPAPPKRGTFEIQPSKQRRLDGTDHLPQFDEKKEATRCKLCIKQRSHVYCEKCNVHLCLQKSRNCFYDYHTKNNESTNS